MYLIRCILLDYETGFVSVRTIMSVVVIILVTDHDVICTIIFAIITIVVIVITSKVNSILDQVRI